MAYDANLVLANQVDISADGNQADQTLPQGMADGNLVQFEMVVEGTITGTTPTLDMKVQGKDASGNYYDVGKFGQLAATGTFTNAAYASKGGKLLAFGRFLKGTTAWRYNADVGGTTPVYNDVTIRAQMMPHPASI